MSVAEIFVFLEEAGLLLSTESLKVRDHLSNLEGMDVVREGHRGECHGDLVLHSAVKPFSGKKLVPHGVLVLAI